MVETVIYVRAKRADVRRALHSLPRRARAGGAVADAMMADCGTALLDRIQEAFAVKSRGGTDEAGEKWAQLSPRTIAQRVAKQRHPQARRPSRGLTDAQRDQWWSVYRRQLARFRGNKASAAKVAWAAIKRGGARTLVDKYGNEKVDILRDTNELMGSLTPNSGSNKSVFQVLPGEVVVGTSRDHALSHHRGVPSRNLPQRRLWPSPDRWPQSWWRAIQAEVRDGIVELAVQVASGAAGQ